MEKMYWFSTKNHAHDVEFRFARLQNEMYEMRNGLGKWEGYIPQQWMPSAGRQR